MAIVSGDPSQAQPFELEFSMPSGYRVAPHFHPTEETVTVKRGTFADDPQQHHAKKKAGA